MYEGRRVAAVVPAYNESAHIADVIRAMPQYVDLIIVVDDASTDATAQKAEAAADPRVQVVRHAVQRGVGGATLSGIRSALGRGADLIVKVDGDGQMDPGRMHELLDPLVREGYDYAKANRFLHSEALRQMPLPRLLGNFALTFLTKLASGHWHIFDPQNGYVAITGDAARAVDLDRIAEDFFFENDMLIQLNVLHRRVKDVAIPARYGNEESKLRLSRVLVSFPPRLLRGFCRRIWEKYVLRDFSPIAVFWLVGAPLMIFGGAVGLLVWAHALWSGKPASTGTVMLGILPFLIGFELILQAIILEIRESPR